MKIQKIHKIYIEDYKIFSNFEIDLTNNGEPLNLVIIAGNNGSGKSTLLEFIEGKISSTNANNRILGEAFDEKSRKFVQITIPSGFRKVEQYSNLIEEGHKEYLANRNIIFYKTYETDINTAKEALIKYIDVLIYEKDIKSSEVYDLVKQRLNKIFKGFNVQVEFNLLDKERNIFFKNERSERIPISQLSGGEKELITKAFTLYISDIKNKIILIDEPESSLHPNWQSRILKIYEDFAIENNNQIIIATHSPHIIAAAKKESLRLLVKKDDKIEVVSNFDGSFGYEVQRVLLEIMDMDSLRNTEIDKKLTDLKELIFKNKYKSDEFVNLKKELEDILGKNDIDLSLLRLEVAKREKMNEKN